MVALREEYAHDIEKSGVYWHVYSRSEIKKDVIGDFICVLAIPRRKEVGGIGALWNCNIEDDFLFNSFFQKMIELDNHGIVYIGVNKKAIMRIFDKNNTLTRPDLYDEEKIFHYNISLISNVENIFLRGYSSTPAARIFY